MHIYVCIIINLYILYYIIQCHFNEPSPSSWVHLGLDDKYAYTNDLRSLQTQSSQGSTVDPRIAVISTPLKLQAWRQRLARHPDQDFARIILEGIEQSATRNMLSATQNPHVIGEYLRKETNGGNMFGPFPMQSAPVVHLNRFGVIPKKYQVDRWRLISDLSFPEGLSVNDAINPRLCSLSYMYITVDQVAAAALNLGNGALLAKIDIKAAYRLVPVLPTDRRWLGVIWEDHIYVDGMLPFGLRSAPKLFNAVADALEWCIAQEGVQHVFHYLDHFVVLGPPRSPACENALFLLNKTCAFSSREARRSYISYCVPWHHH